MTIIPHHDDIFTEKKPYLRKNIVQGAYQNLDHYLDVQFRLLREDFLRPLREGIINLVNHGINQKQGVFKDIRMYRNVKILYPVCSSSGLRHHIHFDNSTLKRVKWENSKRLIFGSLLCLSKDHFQTFTFATVGDRDPKELAHVSFNSLFIDQYYRIVFGRRELVVSRIFRTSKRGAKSFVSFHDTAESQSPRMYSENFEEISLQCHFRVRGLVGFTELANSYLGLLSIFR
jgi:hypothetical protein